MSVHELTWGKAIEILGDYLGALRREAESRLNIKIPSMWFDDWKLHPPLAQLPMVYNLTLWMERFCHENGIDTKPIFNEIDKKHNGLLKQVAAYIVRALLGKEFQEWFTGGLNERPRT